MFGDAPGLVPVLADCASSGPRFSVSWWRASASISALRAVLAASSLVGWESARRTASSTARSAVRTGSRSSMADTAFGRTTPSCRYPSTAMPSKSTQSSCHDGAGA